MAVKKKRPVKRLLITITIILAVIFLVIIPAVSLYMYHMVFGIRYERKPYLAFSIEDFPGLLRERYEFTSNEGQTLTGYNYYREGQEIKGIIIMTHGIGAGHNSYMDCADFFARNGYYVFGFDITGTDESEGSSIRGLPQGVIDLDHAISFVESREEFEGLPILLFGHSWGAFSSTSVLNEHPEVAAVCSVSGFNRSSDLLNSQGYQMIGPVINIMMPYLDLYERIRFGKYATQTSMDGFASSDARVMIIHSADDDTVGISYGYDIYYAGYSDDPDFEFIRYEDKGHSGILASNEQRVYMRRVNDLYQQTFGERTPTDEERAEFFSANIDMSYLATTADTVLLQRVVDFFDGTLGVTSQASEPAPDQDAADQIPENDTIQEETVQTSYAADETVNGTAVQTADETEETTLESTDLTTSPVSEECSDVIEDMIVAYGGGSYDEARELLMQVRDQDPSLADKWETILDMWTEYHDGPSVVMDALPEDLPQTGELCFVVLGYQLNYDGSMRDELIGRLEVALEAASSYPQAYIVCSGGGTAAGDGTATEAGAMAQWLIDNGIGEERVIIEDDSLSTTQNAAYTYEILAREYPQVHEVVLISSDYHIPMAVLIFEGQSLLLANDPDDVPYEVVANASYDGAPREFEMAFWTGSLIELAGDEETAFAYYY